MTNLPPKTLDRITTKYQPLINNILRKGWNVSPFIVLACAKATTHIPSMKNLERKLKLPIITIKKHNKTYSNNCHTICTLNTSS